MVRKALRSRLRASYAASLLVFALGLSDAPTSPRCTRRHRASVEPIGACEGSRPSPPQALYFTLRSAAFPGSSHPDAAVHVPPGFDATRSPGAVLFFHGWRSCVAAALGDEDAPCEDGGDPRPASQLARQIDDARVNALLVAVELRVDAASGEPGELAAPGGARTMLREILGDLRSTLGCALEVDAIDRILVVAHSGGYQAAASLLAFGDLPQVSELILLDAMYGADEVFRSWLAGGHRFVDLYTCCGGTLERSRALAAAARGCAARPWFEDDGDGELDANALARPVVFKRVGAAHGDLPRAYMRVLLENAGFSRIEVAAAPPTQETLR